MLMVTQLVCFTEFISKPKLKNETPPKIINNAIVKNETNGLDEKNNRVLLRSFSILLKFTICMSFSFTFFFISLMNETVIEVDAM